MKICDFGLARDIYKDPDYVRKGSVSADHEEQGTLGWMGRVRPETNNWTVLAQGDRNPWVCESVPSCWATHCSLELSKCAGYVSYCCDETCDKNISIQYLIAEMASFPEREAAALVASVRKERVKIACTQLSLASVSQCLPGFSLSSFSPSVQLGTQAHGIVPSTFRLGLPISANLF